MVSVRTKILLPISIITLIMLILLSMFINSSFNNRDRIVNLTSKQSEERLRAELSSIISHTATLAEQIASNRQTIGYLEMDNQYELLESLTPYTEHEGLDKLIIYNNVGEVFAEANQPSRFGRTDFLFTWLSGLQDQNRSECISNTNNYAPVVLCGIPIVSVNGLVGYVVAGYYINQNFLTSLQNKLYIDLQIDSGMPGDPDLKKDNNFKVTQFNLLEEGLIHKQKNPTPFYINMVEDLTDYHNQTDALLIFSIIVITLNLAGITYLFASFGMISKRILSLNKYVRDISNRDFSYTQTKPMHSKDEIGEIVNNFHNIGESYEEFSRVCESISVGDIKSNIKISHPNDNLGIAVNKMISALRKKTEENIGGLIKLNQLNKELKMATKYSENASKEKSIFISSLSHEIRTPLNGIMAMVEQISKEKLSLDNQEKIEIARSCGTHLLGVVDDSLDFSKIEAGKLILVREPVDLRLLFEDLISVFSYKAEENNIDLLYQVAPNINNIIHVDKKRLRQILTNLINNAFKFTSTGEILITVVLHDEQAQTDELKLLFMVEDSGVGVDRAMKKKLFQPFVQEDNIITRKYPGFGLGLAICARLVHSMNGKIWLGEKKGSGAVFFFTIDVGLGAEKGTNVLRITYPNLHAKKALIINDDDSSWGPALYQSLGELGMAPKIQTPKYALTKKSTTSRFDLILLALVHDVDPWKYISKLRSHLDLQAVPIMVFINTDRHSFIQTDHALSLIMKRRLLQSDLVENLSKLFSDEPTFTPSPKIQPNKIKQTQTKPKPQILIVDDNIMNQYVALSLLSDTGCNANTCSGGHEALELLKGPTFFDIIFVDIHMPDMDGWTLAKKIRKYYLNKKMPLLFAMTADVSKESREKSLAARMTDVLIKPILSKNFIDIINQWQSEYKGDDVPMPGIGLSTLILDLEVLKEYRLATLNSLCKQFNKSGLKYIDQLKVNEKKANTTQIDIIAHKFKGSSLTIGALQLSKQCQELQEASKKNNLVTISVKINELKICYEATKKALQMHVDVKNYIALKGRSK